MQLLKNLRGCQVWPPILNIHLPKTKIKGPDGDDFYLINCPCLSNPINAFEHHLTSNPLMPNNVPVFAWQTADDGWCPMTKDWFMGKCMEIWKKEGLDLLDGHSFKIGWMVHHLMSSVDLWVVMGISHWTLTT